MRKIAIMSVLLLLMGVQVAFAQRSVTGTVISSIDNLPLPGVTVVLRGTTTGTTTGIDGKYTIQVPNNQAVLVFSFVGFTTQEIMVGDLSTVCLLYTSRCV